MTIMMIIINTFCRTERAQRHNTPQQHTPDYPMPKSNSNNNNRSNINHISNSNSNRSNKSSNKMYTKIIQNEICFMMRNRATCLRTVGRI